jgi:hypothetical protein
MEQAPMTLWSVPVLVSVLEGWGWGNVLNIKVEPASTYKRIQSTEYTFWYALKPHVLGLMQSAKRVMWTLQA